MFTEIPIKRGFDAVQSLHALIAGRGVICGGYARFCASPLLDPVPAGDVDVYCHTAEDFDALAEDIGAHLKRKHTSTRAITFVRSDKGLLAFTPEIQLVKPVSAFKIHTVGSTQEILSNFDFTVARAAIISRETALVDVDFLKDEEHRNLSLRNIHCPISSTLRCLKYAKRGYRIHPFDVLPLFLDWDSRTPEYRQELIQGLLDLQKAYGGEHTLSDAQLSAIYELMSVD